MARIRGYEDSRIRGRVSYLYLAIGAVCGGSRVEQRDRTRACVSIDTQSHSQSHTEADVPRGGTDRTALICAVLRLKHSPSAGRQRRAFIAGRGDERGPVCCVAMAARLPSPAAGSCAPSSQLHLCVARRRQRPCTRPQHHFRARYGQ